MTNKTFWIAAQHHAAMTYGTGTVPYNNLDEMTHFSSKYEKIQKSLKLFASNKRLEG